MSIKRVDNKHSMFIDATGTPCLAKRLTTGELIPIPNEEPVILFRGRDKLAVIMLQFYRGLCISDGYTEYQLESISDMIQKFEDFAAGSSTIKQPGITRGQ